MVHIDLQKYIQKLKEKGVDTFMIEAKLEDIISSIVLKQPQEG